MNRPQQVISVEQLHGDMVQTESVKTSQQVILESEDARLAQKTLSVTWAGNFLLMYIAGQSLPPSTDHKTALNPLSNYLGLQYNGERQIR